MFAFQPLIPSPLGKNLEDRAFELIEQCNELKGSVHEVTARGIGSLVQVINCYYSNLIEGHRTTLKELEEARKDFTFTLSKAHILTQMMASNAIVTNPISAEFLSFLHREFFEKVPKEHRILKNDSDSMVLELIPGEFRTRAVKVGLHIPPEKSEEIQIYLNEWSATYTQLSNLPKVACLGAIHHRLLWIHPFLDGNGRVARLLTDAVIRALNLDHYGMWCLSRGLARRKDDYFKVLHTADQERYNDVDGRGALSQKALIECCEFFLETALDQVHFMKKLYNLSHLDGRFKFLMHQLEMPLENADMLSLIFSRGSIGRGEFARLYPGKKERYARNQLSSLLQEGLLTSDTPKGEVRLAWPLKHLGLLMPQLLEVS